MKFLIQSSWSFSYYVFTLWSFSSCFFILIPGIFSIYHISCCPCQRHQLPFRALVIRSRNGFTFSISFVSRALLSSHSLYFHVLYFINDRNLPSNLVQFVQLYRFYSYLSELFLLSVEIETTNHKCYHTNWQRKHQNHKEHQYFCISIFHFVRTLFLNRNETKLCNLFSIDSSI